MRRATRKRLPRAQIYAKYTELIGVNKSAAEVKSKLDTLKLELEQYRSAICFAKTASECQAELARIQAEVNQWKHALGEVQTEVSKQEIGSINACSTLKRPNDSSSLLTIALNSRRISSRLGSMRLHYELGCRGKRS